ncbi:MAG: malto-oligosyltrehalose trehalohydrolase, partial [Gemmatimonadota bacterium]
VYPDPASRSQPEGVHGPSEVVGEGAFVWTDAGWKGRTLEELVVYELHVGTFSDAGTFTGAAERLHELAELGVNAIEVMPIANFPGSRNWGYDGVNLFAPATAYGGVDGFKALVDAAHGHGLAVILDVVYNHLGPEGNYIPAVTSGRFFTHRHRTPWGDGINFDGPGSGAVRDLFVQNALHWMAEYHVDGLRLDATHAIVDDSKVHILAEIAERVRELPGRRRLLIAEDERNERLLVVPRDEGGFGLDAVWADDLHHQLRRAVAGDAEGYFAHYSGTMPDIATTLRQGWWRTGSPSADAEAGFEGSSPESIEPKRFVHCIQNHDQVGNRAMGERLNHQIPASVYRAVSTLLLTAPYTPMLWMGQEWAASTPFLYFTEHPEELGRRVTAGRREEFKRFSAFRDPELRQRIPDPQDPTTFQASKLKWEEREQEGHAGMFALYRTLLHLRREREAFQQADRDAFSVDDVGEAALVMRRGTGAADPILIVVNLAGEIRLDLRALEVTRRPESAPWSLLLATEERRFGGDGGWGRVEPEGTLHLMGPGAVLLEPNSTRHPERSEGSAPARAD